MSETTVLPDTSNAAGAPAAAAPPVPLPSLADPPVRWNVLTRVGFRFVALYCTLYIVCTQMFSGLFGPILRLLAPVVPITPPMLTAPVQQIGSYIAIHWWHFPEPLSANRGAGDKPVDYALAFGLLLIAAALTALWSAVDWRRASYPRLQAWFRVFLRFGLGTSLATYGWIKAFPVQMSYPNLTRLLEPYGDFSLMGVLWAKIGASPAYETFTGCAELLAAVLLLIPGLTTLGAAVALAVTSQVFVLNMTYDVPVKLFSLHLVVMSLVLLAPDARRLVRFFVLKRPTDPLRDGRLFRRQRLHRAALALQVLFAAWVLVGGYQQAKEAYARSGPNAPKPPLYGIWVIDRMLIDGVERAPLVTDYDRWRRLIFQFPNAMTFQRMDNTIISFQAKVDEAAGAIVVTQQNKETGRFTIQKPADDRLVLDGSLNGKPMRLETTYFDRSRFRLVQGRFRWIQDVPFNR
jgi:uncharacterized membrane protein YphA (DoxX/SURF4 family)